MPETHQLIPGGEGGETDLRKVVSGKDGEISWKKTAVDFSERNMAEGEDARDGARTLTPELYDFNSSQTET